MSIEEWVEKYSVELSLASYEGDASRLVAKALKDLGDVLAAASPSQPT